MSGRAHRAALAAAVVALAASLAVGGSEVAAGAPAHGATASRALSGEGAAGAASTAANRRAPRFELATIDGRRFSLARARGKVVVLDFLAPGCRSCAASLPPLSRTALRFGPRRVSFVIVDVSGVNDSRRLREYYYKTYRLPRRVLIGEDRGVGIARAYGLNQLGLTFVIGRDGRIRWQGVWRDERKLAVEIRAALAR